MRVLKFLVGRVIGLLVVFAVVGVVIFMVGKVTSSHGGGSTVETAATIDFACPPAATVGQQVAFEATITNRSGATWPRTYVGFIGSKAFTLDGITAKRAGAPTVNPTIEQLPSLAASGKMRVIVEATPHTAGNVNLGVAAWGSSSDPSSIPGDVHEGLCPTAVNAR